MSEAIEEIYELGKRGEIETIPANSKVELIVNNVDNHATFWMNDNVVFDQSYHGDPALNVHVLLNSWMNIGDNRLRVRLKNWSGGAGNPWHIAYKVKVNEKVILPINVRSEHDGDAANSVAYRRTHILFVGKP